MNKFKYLILVFLFSSISFAEFKLTQIISPPTESENLNFQSLAISNLDDIYLLEISNHELYRFDFSGQLINKSGGFGWEKYNLNQPADICINSGLNVLVADKNNHRLVRFDKNINYITTFPDANTGVELYYPIDIEITKDGVIFILQENNFEILKLNPDNNSFDIIGENVKKEFQLIEPLDIFLTKNEELFVLEKSGKILSFDRYGTPLRIWKKPELTFTGRK